MNLLHPASSTVQRVAVRAPAGPSEPEESLVVDDRAGLTPSELVERKLLYLLRANPLPVSPARGRRRIPGRR
jgi:hypothetical protein